MKPPKCGESGPRMANAMLGPDGIPQSAKPIGSSMRTVVCACRQRSSGRPAIPQTPRCRLRQWTRSRLLAFDRMAGRVPCWGRPRGGTHCRRERCVSRRRPAGHLRIGAPLRLGLVRRRNGGNRVLVDLRSDGSRATLLRDAAGGSSWWQHPRIRLRGEDSRNRDVIAMTPARLRELGGASVESIPMTPLIHLVAIATRLGSRATDTAMRFAPRTHLLSRWAVPESP